MLKQKIIKSVYKNIAKPILFTQDAEEVHNRTTSIGNLMGRNLLAKTVTNNLFSYENKILTQSLHGIKFTNPIGLSAGFDYNGQLTQILGDVGFGFSTVGTVTNMCYEGNPKPQLGRLPKSKSLLVNKGFKSLGAKKIISKLVKLSFDIPVGISLGRTNSSELKTLKQSINDIETAFKLFENSKVSHSYYEMNISCPNLIHTAKNISFYPSRNLEMLLKMLDKLKLSRPLFMKMPITESDVDVKKMLDVIIKHNVQGVIFGNLEKNRKNPVLKKEELDKVGMGNFSGKPCYRRSNELISLAYKNYGNKLTIIGCGGVFNAYNAYEKIKRGASLIQLITGLVFEGPQLIGEINEELVELLRDDGYKNISEAVGAYHFPS